MRVVTAALPARLVAPVLRVPVPLALFAVAAALRLLSFAVFYLGSLATGHNGVVDPYDSALTDHWAWYAAQHLRHGEWVNLTSYQLAGSWDVGFTYLVAFEYMLVGHFSEVPRVVDALIASFTAPAIYLAGRGTVLGEVVARRAGWLTALWPLSIYWAGYDLLKDPLVWFLLALAVLAMTAAGRRRYSILTVASAVPMQLVRLYMGMALYLFLPLTAVLRRDWKGLAAAVAFLAVGEAGLVAIGYPPVWSVIPYTGNGIPFIGSLHSGGVAGTIGDLGGNDPNASSQAEGTGTNAVAVLGGGPRSIAKRLTIGIITTALGPRPALKDIVHPTLDTAMYPGLVVWIPLIPFTILGLVRAFRTREPRVVSVALFAISIWLGLSLLFAGGAFRQREMAFPATLLMTSLGLQGPLPRFWWPAYGALIAVGAGVLLLREAGVF
jgi:hypothetical protein